MKKIALINIRYGYVGGPERYLFNLKHLMESKGHEIIPFSISYPINEPSEYDKYFVTALSDDKSVYYKEQKRSFNTIIKTLERNFYSTEVEENLTRLIKDTKPDFAIVLLYLRKLSPAVLVALNKMNIPFFVRLSDYGMICPGHNFFRNGHICELCTAGNQINSVKHKCVHHSYAASLVNYLATQYHYRKEYFKLIKHFVSPSKFLINKMIKDGWNEAVFHHLPTFANVNPLLEPKKNVGQIIYAGRLEYIKGVHQLIEAVKIIKNKWKFPVQLKIAGNGDEEYVNKLKEYCCENDLSEVCFLGNLNKTELLSNFETSALSVVPSLWYDNLPNSALESLASGTPVIAPNHGCFPEFIKQGKNGFLFEPGNPEDMASKIYTVLKSPDLQSKMSQQSVELVKADHSSEEHYKSLVSIVLEITKNYKAT